MQWLFDFFHKLWPLYLVIAFGILVAKSLRIQLESISRLLIYLIGPIVVFTTVLKMPLTPARTFLPFLFFFFCTIIALISYWVGKFFLRSKIQGMACFMAGSGNAGYFGYPLVISILGIDKLGIAILLALGFNLFENSVGFYMAAQSKYSSRESLRRMLRLPSLYAFFAALFFRFLHWELPPSLQDMATSFRGTIIVMGLLLVGIAVGRAPKVKIDLGWLLHGFFFKCVFWPFLVGVYLILETRFLGWHDAEVRQVMKLAAIVPLPALSTAFAAELNIEPEQVAWIVLLSTLFGLLYIPWVLAFFPL